MNLARMFQCLANAVDSLCEWYWTTPLISRDFSRFFPEITSYSSKGQEFQFVYKARLHQHDWCLTFLARITVNGAEGDSIVVKFVDRYGIEPHELLTSEELAPRLMYFSDLAKRRPGHWYDGFGMVVMEHLEGTTLADKYARSVVSDDVRAAVTKAIGILAGKYLVRGDLRRSNVMVLNGDGKEQVRIIDFDWSGRAEVVRYPLFLSSSVFPAELGIRDFELIEKSHDVVMAERMFIR
ncbi:hypothetical protein HETIRDRAFT_329424 [Heterobasidion irregulare TC 32-1]|uniref:Protein kinase domain-containing protein n=1 Tax=Heterobasidion irregulare (strain TC 32-1) TaxID=747525 RepID=W4JQR6_HETIT|nr:uncharacterized protein HETIRDRAFT_329424 [Heterobasidion irregulare TC 32-1]ETW75878.1 hypothetical protein HETIRDRAFT_329424 [Heterobasidion irregulare TC 32-1]